MSDKKVVETISGKCNKFEIVKDSSFLSTTFYVRKDGKPFRGGFSSLAAAVEAVKKEA